MISEAIANSLTKNLNEGLAKNWLQNSIPGVVGFFWSVILALIAWWVGVRIIIFIRKGLIKGMTRKNTEEGVKTFIDSLVKMALYIILIVVILGLFGIESSSIAAAVAALGLTAGLSLQGSLSNFAGGVLILILKPFEVGDYIIEDTNKNEGFVDEITIFYTKLHTVDNKTVVVPNGNLANSSLTNVTESGKRREDITIGISYDSDIKTAKEVLYKLIEEEDRVLDDEEKIVFVRELNNSSVDIGVRFWVRTDDFWYTKWDFLEKAKYAIEKAGLTIPFPQMDVHFDK